MSTTINWQLYNNTLIDRGKFTFWLPENFEEIWYCCDEQGRIYTNDAIRILTTIRFKYRPTLRETEGFARSLFELLKVPLSVPHFSTLCRRMDSLCLELGPILEGKEEIHVVVDSTGLKVFGEGEWKVRIHGYSKRRTWRKLHLAIDESDNQILAVVLSTNDFKDNEVFVDLMEQVEAEKVIQVTGNGAYDDKKCFEWCKDNQILAVFPPRRGAKIKIHGNNKTEPLLRDEFIREIRQKGRKG